MAGTDFSCDGFIMLLPLTLTSFKAMNITLKYAGSWISPFWLCIRKWQFWLNTKCIGSRTVKLKQISRGMSSEWYTFFVSYNCIVWNWPAGYGWQLLTLYMYLSDSFSKDKLFHQFSSHIYPMGAQWLCGRVFDSRSRGCGLSITGGTVLCQWARHINSCLVLVQHRKTRPDMTEKNPLDWDLKNNKKKHLQ